MSRTQFLAAVLIVAVIGGLALSRLNRGGGTETAEPAGEAGLAGQAAATDESPPEDGADDDAAAEAGGTEDAEALAVVEAPPILEDKPPLENIELWLQTDGDSLDSFAGQVRIVQFWTYACYNCKNTIPHLQDIYAEYHPQGLEIIGVHAPEFDFERDPANVATAAVDLGVTWPIAIDNGKTNFRAWQGSRRFWPRTFVLDQNGKVRFDHIGEGKYDELEATVAHLIEHGA